MAELLTMTYLLTIRPVTKNASYLYSHLSVRLQIYTHDSYECALSIQLHQIAIGEVERTAERHLSTVAYQTELRLIYLSTYFCTITTVLYFYFMLLVADDAFQLNSFERSRSLQRNRLDRQFYIQRLIRQFPTWHHNSLLTCYYCSILLYCSVLMVSLRFASFRFIYISICAGTSLLCQHYTTRMFPSIASYLDQLQTSFLHQKGGNAGAIQWTSLFTPHGNRTHQDHTYPFAYYIREKSKLLILD